MKLSVRFQIVQRIRGFRIVDFHDMGCNVCICDSPITHVSPIPTFYEHLPLWYSESLSTDCYLSTVAHAFAAKGVITEVMPALDFF